MHEEPKRTSSPDSIFKPFDPKKNVEPVFCPSMLSSDFSQVSKELARCRQAGAKWVHIDVMDGHFVPNLTLGPPLLAKWVASQPDLFYDTHLMIENPMAFAEDFAKAGSGLLTMHIETLLRPKRDLRAVKKLGIHVGVTLKPKTPLKTILDVLEDVDLVLVMTVEPGFGGQPMIPAMLNKVRELDLLRRRSGLKFRLEVDGGIDPETAPLAVAAGADCLVAGSAVFKGGKIRENLRALRESVANGKTRN